MIQGMTRFFVRLCEKYLPDPYLFAAILTAITFVLALVLTDFGPIATLQAWGGGIWGLLAFTAQMASIMVFGYAFAKTPAMERGLAWVCGRVRTPIQAYFIISFTTAVISWMVWSVGLIAGAFMAKEIAKRVKGVHYPLLVAAGFSGFLIFQNGITGSIPLMAATSGTFSEPMVGIIPVTQTIFTSWNLFLSVFLGLIVIPFIMTRMHPKKQEDVIELNPSIFPSDPVVVVKNKKDMLPNERIENNYLLNILIGGGLGIYLVLYFIKGGELTINSTNMIFLVLGILLTPTPIAFVRRCAEGAGTVGGVVMQFPLYAGIQGIMVTTGLASVIAGWFVAISTATTLPIWTFISVGIINMFIPSGGGQWVVQDPIMLEAATQLAGADYARVTMAFAYGDCWTNAIQPFWALPLLAIAKLKAKDIMGYLVVVLIVMAVVVIPVIYLWP